MASAKLDHMSEQLPDLREAFRKAHGKANVRACLEIEAVTASLVKLTSDCFQREMLRSSDRVRLQYQVTVAGGLEALEALFNALVVD